MSISDYLENKLLDHSLGTASFTMPAGVYLALFTTDPGEAGGGTEVSGTAYARQAIAFDAASGGIALNSDLIEFPVAGGSWGTVTHLALYDAVSSGNLLYYGEMDVSKQILLSDQLKFEAGEIAVALD